MDGAVTRSWSGSMGEGDLKELRELVEFLKASGVAEFDMERPELKVHLSFGADAAAAAAPGVDLTQLAHLLAVSSASAGAATTPALLPPVAPVAPMGTISAALTAETVPVVDVEVDEDAGLHLVRSPLVGTFYEAASPGAEPFVKIGDRVSSGKVLCVVEAMKIMNEIESEASGEYVKVYAKAGQPVEYGQKLFGVRA